MIATQAAAPYLTLGQLAQRYHCQLWQIHRLFSRKLVAEVPRIGRTRVVPLDRVPEFAAALKKAGYTTQEIKEGDNAA